MASDEESFRGVECGETTGHNKKNTLDKIIQDGYDTKLSIFEVSPALIKTSEQETNNGSNSIKKNQLLYKRMNICHRKTQ
jgi:hypothetical protein